MPYAILNQTNLYPIIAGGTDPSQWVAVGGVDSNSHTRVNIVRQDFEVSGTTNSSGNTNLAIGITLPTLTVGGRVYIMLANKTGFYNIISAGANNIVIDLPWTSNQAGFVNLITDFSNYRFVVNFMYSTDGGSTWVKNASAVHVPGPDQSVWIDASVFYKNLLKITSTPIASGAIANDQELGADVYAKIETNEVYTSPDGLVDQASDGTDIYLRIVNTANQIQNPKGISLVKHITDGAGHSPLKFLGSFTEPTYFNGFPFSLGFINPEFMIGTYDTVLDQFDSAGSTLSQITSSFATSIKGHVNRLFIRGAINSLTRRMRIIIVDGSATAFSEYKYMRIVQCSKANPVFLKWWYNGAWNYWLYNFNQVESNEVTASQGTFSKFQSDLALMDTDSDFVSRETMPDMTLGAQGLDLNDITGLKTILSSSKVMMLSNLDSWTTDGDKWVTVKIKTGKYKIRETGAALSDISFTMVLPEIYNVTN